MTPDQFITLEQSLREEIRAQFQGLRQDMRKPVSPWLDRKAAAQFLRIGRSHLDLYKRQGKLDPRYVGKKPLYLVEQLQKLPSKSPCPNPPGL